MAEVLLSSVARAASISARRGGLVEIDVEIFDERSLGDALFDHEVFDRERTGVLDVMNFTSGALAVACVFCSSSMPTLKKL